MVNLVPWRKKEKEQPPARLRDEFETLFDRFLSRLRPGFEMEQDLERLWGMDFEDCDDEFVIRAEAPGFEPDELDVQLSGRLLTIKAEKQQESTGDGGRAEARSYRSFYRSLTLPEGVKTDGIDARYHSGVLEIHLPKSEEAKAKRIMVQA